MFKQAFGYPEEIRYCTFLSTYS